MGCDDEHTARQQVVNGLNSTASALNTVSAQANATGNTGVGTLVTAAQSELNAAVSGVANIGAAISSGATPSRTEYVLEQHHFFFI